MSKLVIKYRENGERMLYRDIWYNHDQLVAQLPEGMRLNDDEFQHLVGEWQRRDFPKALTAAQVKNIMRHYRAEQKLSEYLANG